jgi:hypothetical protein
MILTSLTQVRIVPLSAGHEQVEQVEHRLFSHIAVNWRGTPLVNLSPPS